MVFPVRAPSYGSIGRFKIARTARFVATGQIPYEIAVAAQQTTEILRPWAGRSVEDGVADIASTQFLRLGWEAEKRVDFPRGE